MQRTGCRSLPQHNDPAQSSSTRHCSSTVQAQATAVHMASTPRTFHVVSLRRLPDVSSFTASFICCSKSSITSSISSQPSGGCLPFSLQRHRESSAVGGGSGWRQRRAARSTRGGSTDGLDAVSGTPGAGCRGPSGCGRPASAAGRPTLHRSAQGGLPRDVLPAADRRHCARGPAAPLAASPVCSPLAELCVEQAAAMGRAVGSNATAAKRAGLLAPLHLPAGGAAAACRCR